MDTPNLSVVVGSSNARLTIEACLDRLVAQCAALGGELVVVDNSTDGTDMVVRERYPTLRLLRSARAHIPELWAEGIGATTGTIVALTTAHAVPGPDWAASILREHEADHAGVGGAVDNTPAASLSDWAIYFCRYHSVMPPFEAGQAREIAGDNAAYKREALDAVASTWEAGFWEPPVHAALRARGRTLWLTPGVVVVHGRSFGVRSFLRNRVQHGRQYGADRAAGSSWATRAGLAVRTPLVPAVLTGRVARAVLRRRRHLRAFVGALPLIVVFYGAWAVGELLGVLSAPEAS